MVTNRHVPDIAKCPLGGKPPPVENHWFKWYIAHEVIKSYFCMCYIILANFIISAMVLNYFFSTQALKEGIWAPTK